MVSIARTHTSLRRIAALSALAALMSANAQQVTPWQTSIAATADSTTLPVDRGADGLWQTLKKLHTRASLMMITAHPDDEDGGMMALESRGMGARTALMTLTRGEGGQDAMGSETYDALGLMRTNELLLADQYTGTEQYWSRVADYGFSKTIDEAFQQWGHDRVLYDVVRAVRLNRPLVLTSVFTGNITDGHGHHQVAGAMAQEVFKAACDPKVFPDQIAAGLLPWCPVKVYERVPGFFFSSTGVHRNQIYDYATDKWSPMRFYNYLTKQWTTTTPETNVEIPEGNLDPILGQSYLQIARQGWALQKSQNGGGNPPLPGPMDVSYHRYGSLAPAAEHEQTFFDGIDTSLEGIATLAHGDAPFLKAGLHGINQNVTHAMLMYTPSEPQKLLPDLHDGYMKTKALMNAVTASTLSAEDKANLDHELGIKLVQFNTALAQVLGLQVNALVTPRTKSDHPSSFGNSAEATPPNVTPGAAFDLRLHVTAAGGWGPGTKLRLRRTWLETPASEKWPVERIGAPGMENVTGAVTDIVFRVEVPRSAAATKPYFSRKDIAQPYYHLDDPRWLNRPFAPFPVAGWAEFDYDGVPVRIGQVAQTMHWVHGPGAVFQPLVVTPQLSVTISPGAGVTPLGSSSFPLTVKIANEQQDNATGDLQLQLPQGWTSEPAVDHFHLAAGEKAEVAFTVRPANLGQESYKLRAVARSGNEEFSEGFETVGYPGLRPYNLYHPATYRTRGVDVKVAPGIKVGYIMGTGDEVPEALRNIGVDAHLLTADEVATGDLSQYTTIVLGIRAYAARPELTANNQRLLDYVKNGGNLVVQYERDEFNQDLGPYPYTLGRSPEKVVDESDTVTILDASNPLLNAPNHITSADFNGWVEERGHSFMTSWDSNYKALTETHDPGQDPQRGGLLYAKYGKGTYVYVAYALYRQLPEAVPGAYRIFANLVSAGK